MAAEGKEMKITLCDDESVFRSELKGWLETYFTKQRISIQLKEYEDMKRLIAALDSGQFFHVMFLDIKMGEDRMDGIKAARVIAARHLRSIVVFVSSYDTFISELMEVKAF